MKIQVGSEIGGGQFATVYEGTDVDLGRPVAIKIVRASGELVSSALDHARALARTNHPNLVTVYGLETVQDPKTNAPVAAIIMERLEGTTLDSRLGGQPFTKSEVQELGVGLIDGLAHIHERGLAHQDLHEENILLIGSRPKIIDIMYTTSLARLGPEAAHGRLRRDVTKLRGILEDSLFHSELPATSRDTFANNVHRNVSLPELRQAFCALFSEQLGQSIDAPLTGTRRVRDPLDQMIAHRMRDALFGATAPMVAFLGHTGSDDASSALRALMLTVPPPGARPEYPDNAVLRPIALAIVTPRVFELTTGPIAPSGIRWIGWILLDLQCSAADVEYALKLYAGRGPSILIAQFEELRRHLANTLHGLSTQLQFQPDAFLRGIGQSYIEHTLRTLIKAQRVWMGFLTQWQSWEEA